MKTIPVTIYKSKYGDCSNGGVSSKYNELYLACEQGFLDIPEDDPKLIKLEKNAFGTVRAVPYQACPSNLIGYMFGGCYVATSDSRFGEEVRKMLGKNFYGAIALHDRTETQEQYDALSK